MEKYRASILEDLRTNKTAYLTVVFFILVGLSAGAYTAAKMPPEDKSDAINYISVLITSLKQSNIDFFKVFIYSCLQNAFFFVIIILFSFWPLTIPVILFAEALKGFYIGFAIGVLTLEYSANSFLLVLVVVMLPNLILLPCFIKAGVCGIKNAFNVFKNRKIPSTAKDKLINSKPYLKQMLKITLLLLAGVIIETVVTPLLIKAV